MYTLRHSGYPLLEYQDFMKFLKHMASEGYHAEQDPYNSRAMTLQKPFFQNGRAYPGDPKDFTKYENIHDDEVLWPDGVPWPMYIHTHHYMRTPLHDLNSLRWNGKEIDWGAQKDGEFKDPPVTIQASSASLEQVVASRGTMFPMQNPVSKTSVPGYRTHDVKRKDYQILYPQDYDFDNNTPLDYWIDNSAHLERMAVKYLRGQRSRRRTRAPEL